MLRLTPAPACRLDAELLNCAAEQRAWAHSEEFLRDLDLPAFTWYDRCRKNCCVGCANGWRERETMKRRKLYALLSLLLLLAIPLTACGAAGPGGGTAAGTETAEAALPEGAVLVSTVDEFLAAIAPNAVIVLQEGEYDLSTAADYGEEDLQGYYHWELIYGGCELVISNVPGLRLMGQGQVSILAKPRYAEVLSFRESWDLSLEGLTLGHTLEPGPCAAGVLELSDCDNVQLAGCRLFGCGSMGITALNCQSVAVRGSQIDSCSDGAVTASGCRDIRLEDCKLCDCGLSQAAPGNNLIYTERCVGLALVNCEITGNRFYYLLHNQRSSQVAMLGCQVESNRVLGSVFLLENRSVTVDKCSFRLRSGECYYTDAGAVFAQDIQGEKLISFDLDHMELGRAEYDGPVEPEPVQGERTELPEGMQEVHVRTVEEFLAAIAPDTCIVLEEGVYDLSTAADYGGRGGDWYSWEECYDGFSLCLSEVTGLRIRGAGREDTLISAQPRYAAVFSFQNCRDVGLAELTAGHSEAPAYCVGNVLDFDSCRDVSLDNCGLFGCGVMGIWAWNCENLQVQGTEIYECSSAAATIDDCRDVSFDGCSIYDCDEGNDILYVHNCSVTWNGENLSEGTHGFDRERYTGKRGQAW